MKPQVRRSGAKALAMVTSVALALIAFVLAGPASADTKPTFEPDPASAGSVSFYNAAGSRITTGSINDAPMAAYYRGSGGGINAGDNKAFASFYTPTDNAPTVTWSGTTASTAQTFPAATAYPGSLAGTTDAVVAGSTSSSKTLANFVSVFPNASAKDPGIYQVRIFTTQAGSGGSDTYYSADIKVTGTTWTQIYPAPASGPATTATTLTVSPASPQVAGTSVTLSATVAPAAGGTVQFKDGSNNIGSPVTVVAGSASTSTTTLAVGPHSLTAAFTPTDAAAFAGSTSAAQTYVIDSPPATTTKTALSITPDSPITVGTASTLTATVSPSTAAGSVQFLDGATPIGAAATVLTGSATTTTTFGVNTHQVKAVFTPADAVAFTASTSPAQAYVVNPPPATTTATTLAVAPAGPQVFGTSLALTATVSPASAVGAVQFLDGTTVLSTVAVSGGSAATTNSTLAVGTHQLSAKFVPTSPATFGTSQSTTTPAQITKATPTATLVVTPAGPVVRGTAVTLKATVTPTLAGTVQFLSAGTPLGSATVSGKTAQLSTTTLATGSHSLSALFTPTSTNYATATSNTVPLSVTPPPPATSTTALTVTPTGPVAAGTKETLKATISPASATGSVQFLDGTTAVGAPVDVVAGVATAGTTLEVGSHPLTAKFTSSDAATFKDSTSAVLTYLVKPPATATSTTLTVAPPGPVAFGTAITLHATVSPAQILIDRARALVGPSVPGSVTFRDGAVVLGTKTLTAGEATLTTVGLHAGTHSLTATYIPASTLDYVGSTSAPVALVVTKVTTVTSLAVSPGGPVAHGRTVTLTASITPATATGRVIFKNGTTVLGSAAVAQGKAVLKTSTLPVGTASLTATFAPTAVGDFSGSTSAKVTLAVSAAVPAGPSSGPTTTPAASPSSSSGSGGVSGHGGTSSGLASTGADVLGILTIGLSLVTAGWFALSIGVRRRHGLHRL